VLPICGIQRRIAGLIRIGGDCPASSAREGGSQALISQHIGHSVPQPVAVHGIKVCVARMTKYCGSALKSPSSKFV
jgi:hypothetical protein